MKTEKFLTNTFFVSVLAVLCCALWGSATPFIKIGYELMMPVRDVSSTLLFAGIRFFLAGILTVIVYSAAEKKFVYPQKENWGKITLVSAFQTVLQYLFFYIGLANTSGVKGTIMSGSSSFFAIVIASLLFRQEKLTLKKVIACIIGFAGIVAVNLNGLDWRMNFTGDAFVLFSAIFSGTSAVLTKRYSQKEKPYIISGYQFIIGGFVMAMLGFILGGSITVDSVKALFVLLYLALLSAIAYSVWGTLLKYNPVSKVTVFSFTTPVLGVILSNLLLTEKSNVTPLNIIISLVLICTGITVLNYSRSKR